MIYVSYAELAKDIVEWSQQLPRNIDAFVALPRSGVIPASMLALHRNVRLTTVDDFKAGRYFLGGYRDQVRSVKKVMVIDDSLLSGKSMNDAANKLKGIKDVQILYGAVYVKPGVVKPGIHTFKQVEMPRIFEWNWLHHFWLQRTCMDIDGVLCRDPTNEENDDGLRYRKFLHTVEPRHIPTVEVHTLVTSRLEQYRDDTVRWLHRHGVTYKNLIMHPAESAKARRKAGDHSKRKAQVYRDSHYQLFIESSQRQAEDIHARTDKPVLCTDTGVFYS